METGVYAIRNKVNGKLYVGSASLKFEKRWTSHKHYLSNGTHFNVKLQRAWVKYGSDSFEFVILKRCPPEECVAAEQTFIDDLDLVETGYNIAPIAGCTRGSVRSEESRKRLSACKVGHPVSAETREKLSKAFKGRPKPARAPISEETRAKMSVSASKRFRSPMSEETKMKIAEANRGRLRSDAVKERISASKTGVRHTDEARAKMSEFQKSRVRSPRSEATKAKLSIANRGKQPSDETRAKLALAVKESWHKRKLNKGDGGECHTIAA